MNSATWAWIALGVNITLFVLGYDLWAQATGHPTMSEQFHIWMQSQIIGPLIVGVWFAISTGFIYHFLINR